MKKLNFFILLGFAVISVIFVSCNPNEDNITPTDTRDYFTGTWSCVENSSIHGKSSYAVTIEKDPSNSAKVLISNFYQLGYSEKVSGIVAGKSISISQQTVCSCNIKGSGNYNSNTITWDYEVSDNADLDKVSATYTKK